MNEITVRYIDGTGAWCVLGGGLPEGSCWSQHDTQEEAEAEAAEVRADLGL
jgi:hypothetical protein